MTVRTTNRTLTNVQAISGTWRPQVYGKCVKCKTDCSGSGTVSPCAGWEGSVAAVQRVLLYGDGRLAGGDCIFILRGYSGMDVGTGVLPVF